MCAGTVDNPQCKVVDFGATFENILDFFRWSVLKEDVSDMATIL